MNESSVVAFADAASRYWLGVFPQVGREVRQWRIRAREIPDPELRVLALENLNAERGNLDGAAAFAAFVPQGHRARVVRALVAFQATYDYLDTLAEQPSGDPVRNGRCLHHALLVALDGATRDGDFYAHHAQREDGGYLCDLVDTCRSAFLSLPGSPAVAAAVHRAAARIVSYQSFNLSDARGGHEELARWARHNMPAERGLRWWEVAASSGSSMAVFALIAAAAKLAPGAADVEAIERAYFPWIGALHTLLDSLVDRPEDAALGQRCLLDYYDSEAETAARLRLLASESLGRAEGLSRTREHALILAAMASNYLSAPEAFLPGAVEASRGVLGAMAPLATPTMLVFSTRRRLRSRPAVALRVPPLRLYSRARDRDHRARTASGYSRE